MKHGLSESPRLVEQITVEDEWARAVETVLGESLQALCLPNLDDVEELLTDSPERSFKLIASDLEVSSSKDQLASRIGGNINV